ncbi:Hypp4854 [Branchiostoma lanceolatum]|uniref:Hypp4854 protein n=1 Tax=Branchiostoma lanceolatum TaxID=7740 RepID=A0A8K0ADJ1_BRALA|nr:Hypp4854 [Branchiostoma lanceolatum]
MRMATFSRSSLRPIGAEAGFAYRRAEEEEKTPTAPNLTCELSAPTKTGPSTVGDNAELSQNEESPWWKS